MNKVHLRQAQTFLEKYTSIIESIFVGIVCMEFALGVYNYAGHTIPYTRYILWIFFLGYLMMALCHRYDRTEVILFVVTEIIGAILYMKSGINTGIKAPVFVMACKNVNHQKMIKSIFFSGVVVFSLIVMANLLFGIGDRYLVDIRSTRGFHGIRFEFGFTNPNMCQFIASCIFFLYLLLYSSRVKMRYIIMGGVIFLILDILTSSLTGLVIGMIILGLYVCKHYYLTWNWNTILLILQCIILFVCLTISVRAAMYKEDKIMLIVNKLISGRIDQLKTINNEGYETLGFIENWRLFGSERNKNVYDLGYVQLFYYYGIIPGIEYLSLVSLAIYRLWKNKRTDLQIALLGFTLYLFMEARYFCNYLTFDLLFVLSAIAIWSTQRKKE